MLSQMLSLGCPELVNEMPEDPAERTKFIESKGGVSVVATVISIAIYIGLYLFI